MVRWFWVSLVKLHHIGIASNNLERSIRQHEELFGLNRISTIVEDPLQKVSLILMSDQRSPGIPIELVAPLGDQSPIRNLLKKGMHLYHLCYSVDDIESTLKKARKQKAIVVSGPSPARLYNGQRIAFIYTPDGYLVEFLEEKAQSP